VLGGILIILGEREKEERGQNYQESLGIKLHLYLFPSLPPRGAINEKGERETKKKRKR
jgi:hypothetical protein